MERERKDGAVAKEDRKANVKEQVTNAIQAGEQELETHFVENPFIKLR